MHHSRLCAVLIDCRTDDLDSVACFRAAALGRPVDPAHTGSRGDYRMLETPPDEPIVQIRRVEHESRVHIDIETDDIPAEVVRLETLVATVINRLERWVVMQFPTGQRFCVVRVQRRLARNNRLTASVSPLRWRAQAWRPAWASSRKSGHTRSAFGAG